MRYRTLMSHVGFHTIIPVFRWDLLETEGCFRSSLYEEVDPKRQISRSEGRSSLLYESRSTGTDRCTEYLVCSEDSESRDFRFDCLYFTFGSKRSHLHRSFPRMDQDDRSFVPTLSQILFLYNSLWRTDCNCTRIIRRYGCVGLGFEYDKVRFGRDFVG